MCSRMANTLPLNHNRMKHPPRIQSNNGSEPHMGSCTQTGGAPTAFSVPLATPPGFQVNHIPKGNLVPETEYMI